MNIKIFQAQDTARQGSEGGLACRIEKQMNKWLADNPKIRIVSVHLSSAGGAEGGCGHAVFDLFAAVVYDELIEQGTEPGAGN